MIYLKLESEKVVFFNKEHFSNNIDNTINNVLVDVQSGIPIIDAMKTRIGESIMNELELNAPFTLTIKEAKNEPNLFHIEEKSPLKNVLSFPHRE